MFDISVGFGLVGTTDRNELEVLGVLKVGPFVRSELRVNRLSVERESSSRHTIIEVNITHKCLF